MTQVIRLVKRDEREIQSWIDTKLLQVERFLGRSCQITALVSLFALVKHLHPAAEIAFLLFILSLGAYHDRRRIARFLALNFTREELLVLQVTRQQVQS